MQHLAHPIAFQCRIDVALAHIVQGLTIISSPGEISKAPTEHINPDVQEFTEIAYLTLKKDNLVTNKSR